MMRIEWLYPFLPKSQYLVFATVCKEWRAFLGRVKYPKITTLSPITGRAYLDWILASGARKSTICYNIGKWGNLDLLKYARSMECHWKVASVLLQIVARRGDLDMYKWIEQDCMDKIKGVGDSAVFRQYCREKESFCTLPFAPAAIEGNHLEMLKHVFPRVKNRHGLMLTALRCGRVEIAQWVWDQGPQTMKLSLFGGVQGGIEILKWMIGKPCRRDAASAYEIASYRGTLEILDCLGEFYTLRETIEATEHSSYTWAISDRLALCADIEIIEWFLKEGVNVCDSLNVVAEMGHLHVLEWARRATPAAFAENSVKIIRGAACGGHVNILEWAFEQGFSWGENPYARAANFQVIKWLYDHGCPPGERAYENVFEEGTEALEWLRARQFPVAERERIFIKAPIEFAILRWLYEHGMRFGYDILDEAIKSGNVENVKWAIATGSGPFAFSASLTRVIDVEILEAVFPLMSLAKLRKQVEGACRCANIKLLEWFWARDKSAFGSDLTAIAAESGDLHVIKWLLARDIGWAHGNGILASLVCRGKVEDIRWVLNRGYRPDLEYEMIKWVIECGTEQMYQLVVEELRSRRKMVPEGELCQTKSKW